MIPIWIKLAYTLMAVVVVVVYWRKYGLGNFLWFSDIALILLVPALWYENRLLASMMAVGVLIPELFWTLAYFSRLLTGKRLPLISGLVDYMFDSNRPRWLRALSLFHVPLPPLLLWLLFEWGYEPNALFAQTALAWAVLPLSYWLTDPKENVNWVHGWGRAGQRRLSPGMYRGVQMLVLPVLIYLPTHALLLYLIGPVR